MEESEESPPLELSTKLKDTVPSIKSLVLSLTCNICKEPFNNPVLTGCGHTFCSVCIRKYLVHIQRCPQCYTETSDGQLRSNRVAGECSSHLRVLVENLDQLISENRFPSGPVAHKSVNRLRIDSDDEFSDENVEPNIIKERRTSQKQKQSQSPLKENVRKTEKLPALKEKPLNSTKVKEYKENVLSETSGSQSLLRRGSQENTENQDEIECMICQMKVPTKNINAHVDTCLNKREPPVKPVAKRKPLPKLVYTLLKDTDLRKKCKELGLNNKGDRRTLINRHQKYCVLYNSECDIPNPRGRFELLRQIEREEAMEKKGQIPASSLLRFDKNADSKAIEEKHKEYMNQNKSSFQHLISKVRNQQQKNKQEEENKPDKPDQEFPAKNATDSNFPAKNVPEEEFTNKDDESKYFPTKNTLSQVLPSFDSESDCQSGDDVFYNKPNMDQQQSMFEEESQNNDIETDVDSNLGSGSTKRKQMSDESSDSSKKPKLDSSMPSQRTETSTAQSSTQRSTKDKGKSTLANSKRTDKRFPSIQESLAKSVERTKSVSKQECPVCCTQVSERYLNIHLDKCLRANEPESSPVIKKQKPGKKGRSNPRSKIFTSSEDDSEEEDDLSLPPDSPSPKKAGRGRRKCQAVILIDSDTEDNFESGYLKTQKGKMAADESEEEEEELNFHNSSRLVTGEEDEGQVSSQNSSHLVAEPSLDDLITMGLGSKAEGIGHEVHQSGADESTEDDSKHADDKITEDVENESDDDDNLPLSNVYDQYTDNLSQQSYQQDSDDLFETSEGKDDFLDDTLNNIADNTLNVHIDNLADKYFDDDDADDDTTGSDQKNIKNDRPISPYSNQKSRITTKEDTCQPSSTRTSRSKTDKSTKLGLFQSATDLMKSRAAASRKVSSEEEIEDKINSTSSESSVGRFTRARGRRYNK